MKEENKNLKEKIELSNYSIEEQMNIINNLK